MHLTGVDFLLWALAFLGHCILLAVLVAKRRAGQFPVFTAFVSVNVVKTVVLYGTLRFGSFDQYFNVYWTLAILDAGLQLGLAYELATQVFQPLGAWAPDVRRSVLGLAGVSLAVAFGLTWLAAPATQTLRSALVIRGDLFASVLISEVFVAMVGLSVTLGLPWRTHVARLAQGLGVFSVYSIVIAAAHTYFGTARGKEMYKHISQLQIALYLVCLGYWTVTLARREPEPRKLPDQLHGELRALQQRAVLVLESLRGAASSQGGAT